MEASPQMLLRASTATVARAGTYLQKPTFIEEVNMPKRGGKTTGRRVARVASRLLRSKKTSKGTKSVAASALAQKVRRGKR